MKLNHLSLPVVDIRATRKFFERYFRFRCTFEADPDRFVGLADDAGLLLTISNFDGNGTTSIEWFYVLIPAGPEAVATIKEKILARYRGRLENAMNIIKADLEQASV